MGSPMPVRGVDGTPIVSEADFQLYVQRYIQGYIQGGIQQTMPSAGSYQRKSTVTSTAAPRSSPPSLKAGQKYPWFR